MWTVTESTNLPIDAPQYYFSRPRKQYRNQKLLFLSVWKPVKEKSTPHKFAPDILYLEQYGFAPGTYFDIQFEIYPGGREHPVPYYIGYGALPRDNLQHLRQLGCRITWEGPKGRVSACVRAHHKTHTEQNGLSHRGFMTGLMAFFLGDPIVDERGKNIPHVLDPDTCLLTRS